MRRITASKAGLARICSYWLRDDVELPPEPTASTESEADDLEIARRSGNRIHDLIHHDDGTDAYEDEAADPRLHAAREFIGSFGGGSGHHERAFGSDGISVAQLGEGRSSYDARPECTVAGTVDWYAVENSGDWRVVDWKSGDHGARHAREQLRTLGALVLSALGGSRVVLQAVHFTAGCPSEARVFDHGTIDPMDAESILAELHAIEPGEPIAGEHCADYYCPLRGRCPAFVAAGALASDFLPVADLVRAHPNPLLVGVHDEETARIAADLLPLVEKRVDELKADLRGFVGALPGASLELPDGRRFAQVRRNVIDGKRALKLAEDAGATVADLSACRSGVDAKAALALAERVGAARDDLATCMGTSGVWQRIKGRHHG